METSVKRVTHYNNQNFHPEVNAFLHQQMAELKPLLPADALLGVTVHPEKQRPVEKLTEGLAERLTEQFSEQFSEQFTVTLIIVWQHLRLEASGSSENIFDAICKAREGANAQLGALQESLMDTQGRTLTINEIMQSRNIH